MSEANATSLLGIRQIGKVVGQIDQTMAEAVAVQV